MCSSCGAEARRSIIKWRLAFVKGWCRTECVSCLYDAILTGMRATAPLCRRDWGEYENASTYDDWGGFVDDSASGYVERGAEEPADGSDGGTSSDYASTRRDSRFRADYLSEDGRAAGPGAEYGAAEEAGGRYRQTVGVGDRAEDGCGQYESKYLIEG